MVAMTGRGSHGAPWALGALLAAQLFAAAGCGSAPPSPAAAAPAAPAAPSDAAPTDEEICAAPAPEARRAAAGAALPDISWGEVQTVDVSGAEGHETAVHEAIRLRAGQPLAREVIRQDIERLWTLGVFDDVTVRAVTSPAGLAVTYQLEARPTTARVVLRGVVNLEQHVVDDAVQLRPGKPFQRRFLAWSRLGLVEAYRAAGYRAATVEPHALIRGEQAFVCLEADEGPRVTISEWSFSGVRRIDEAEVRSLMDTRDGRVNTVGGVYRPELWALDALRLLALYYDRGFVTARVGEPELVPSPDGKQLRVTVSVEEGKRYRVGSVSVGGAGLVPGRDYRAVIQTKSGEPFSRQRVMEDIARLKELHESASEWSAGVEVTPLTTVDADRAVVDLQFQIQ